VAAGAKGAIGIPIQPLAEKTPWRGAGVSAIRVDRKTDLAAVRKSRDAPLSRSATTSSSTRGDRRDQRKRCGRPILRKAQGVRVNLDGTDFLLQGDLGRR